MFVIPALLSITLDATLAIIYFRQLLGEEEKDDWLHLLDPSHSNFDLAAAAVLRILFLCPYIWSYMHRLRIVYSLLPWTWEAANMALITARLVFLLSGLVKWDVEYFLVGASYASVILQALCLEHLRSSAPRERRIFLLGGVGGGGGLLDPALQPLTSGLSSSSSGSHQQHRRGSGGGGRELYDGHQEDVDFIATITAKMKRAKAYWQGKTEALRVLWNDLGARTRGSGSSGGSGGGGGGGGLPPSQQPFNLLLRLFTYEDVLGELDEAFAHDPGSVEFYVPQLVTFLLYGAFWSSGSLQAFLLDKCGRSVQFAHRLYWFLHAACLHGSSGINPEGVRQLTALIDDVKARGQRAAARVEEGRTPQELHPHGHRHHGHGQQHHRHWGRSKDSGAGGSMESQYSKEMQPRDSHSHSHSTNRTSSLGVGAGAADGTYIDVASLQPPAPPLTPPPVGNAPVAVTAGGGSSSVPTSPRASGAAASARFPLEQAAYRGADGDLFGVLPSFVDALTDLSRDLMLVPRDKRTATLRAGLQEVGAKFLPSNVIYMPVGNPYHRVWRVHAMESFAFSTKERVPCLVCFEVVDYARPHRRGKGGKHGGGKWWSAMGMQENPLPAISHTFKFGNKEWTLKIGEPKDGPAGGNSNGNGGGEGAGKEGAEYEEEEERADVAVAATASLLGGGAQPGPSSSMVSTSGAAHTAAPSASASAAVSGGLSSPLRRLTSSGGPGTIDGSTSGGMGQWASGQEPAAAETGLSHLVLDIASTVAEDKEPVGGGAGTAESRDDYGTFSPPATASPVAGRGGGGHRPLLPEEEEAQGEETKKATSSTTAAVAPSTPRGSYAPPAVPVSPATAAAQAPVIFKERWKQKEQRIRARSQIGHLPRWRLLPVIVKANDDLRQEQFASQLLRQIDQILREAELPVWMRPYDIVATSHDGGLIEAIPDTVSLDALRRNDPQYTTLTDFFERLFGQRGSQGLARARQCFVESLAAYSIVCFLLQIKDRHNGNILLDAEGHIIHIDFGFLLARSPGNVNFEKAPFKLTSEFVEVMEGPRSATFKRFRELCVKTYLELRRQRHKIILLVEMVVNGNETLPCFGGRPQATVEALRQRFQPEANDRACSEYVNRLIDESLDNWRTRWYDRYQSYFELR